ncbi:MAG TPA: HNH endonuclease [Ktedonobacterales bacterium]|nr:HNH endonuclease [Ktedonobacterales bacterium]
MLNVETRERGQGHDQSVDLYPEHIGAAIEALLGSGGCTGGREQLAPIAYAAHNIPPHPGLTRALAGRIFQRDRFICRYCAKRTILTSVMELVATIYPDIFPFNPNWKGGLTHPAIINNSAVVHHVFPSALGGPSAESNLVTACWPCNAKKGDLTLDQLGWSPRAIAEQEAWAGLTGQYSALWERAGKPKPVLHLSWMKCVGVQLPQMKGQHASAVHTAALVPVMPLPDGLLR